MRLKTNRTCKCGADCPAGTNVRMERVPVDNPRAWSHEWQVVACPACDVSMSRVADVGVDRLEPGITLKERLRRNAVKERKRREKQGTK